MKTQFDVPRNIVVCTCCSGVLSIEAVEWLVETCEPTEAGLYVDCGRRCPLDYGTGVALLHKVYLWSKDAIRIDQRDEREEREMLRQWNAGEPIQ